MPCEYILFMTYLFLSVLSGQMYIPCMKKKHKTHTSYLFCFFCQLQCLLIVYLLMSYKCYVRFCLLNVRFCVIKYLYIIQIITIKHVIDLEYL